MSWFSNYVKSSSMLSMYAGILSTGCYVSYKDYHRTQRMVTVYRTGNILPPISENHFETAYQERFYDEKNIKRLLAKTFNNEYYVVNGDVGVGKSRLIRKVTRDLINTSGKSKEGAPIYVTAEQGKTFPDTLAEAVKFYYDEHIGFMSFVDIIFKIESLPRRDDKSKLTRVLDAIEESAFIYMMKYKKPVILIIDDIALLNKQMPNALKELQDKAKLWADSNIVKLVLVNNDEDLDLTMQTNSSSWSRVASPILISDLSHQEAVQFLTSSPIYQKDIINSNENEKLSIKLTVEEAEKIIRLVGGRILHLIAFKTEHRMGYELDEIEMKVINKEQEKFVNVSKNPQLWQVISKLRQMPGKSMKLSKLIKFAGKQDVDAVSDLNIIRYC